MDSLTKRILLISFFMLAHFTSGQSQPRRSITQELDLQGKVLRLEHGTILTFSKKGVIRNGTIYGSACRVETDSIRPLFFGVALAGEWEGSINDAFFAREKTPDDDWQIVANVMKFNDITFSRKSYYLTRWKSILMNGGDVTIHGNGVRLVLPSEKGSSRITLWGKRYNEECILSSRTQGHRIEINDLSFFDTKGVFQGFGSDTEAEKPVLYYYLAPTQADIVLNRVHSDGQGTLLEIYNFSQNLSKIELNGCHIRTCQFAIEVANVERDTDKGHLDVFQMDSCSVYRYPNAVLCGPVSIVGRDGGVSETRITNSTFIEENAGNIEISGVDRAYFNRNTCTNLSFYDGDRPPAVYECCDNTFNLTRVKKSAKSRALSMGGKRILLSRNTYNILAKPHPFIELYQPHLVESLVMTDNAINYKPATNPPGFSCLFSIKSIPGIFVFSGNSFSTSYTRPEIDCLFPKNAQAFEDPSSGKIRIIWR